MSLRKEYMVALYHQFCSIKDISGLANLLQVSRLRLYQLRFEKPYISFEIKKQNGKNRLIETPQKELKAVLHKLNNFLQCSYFFNRTSCAYGFVQQPRNSNKKKSILTNAKAHCGKKYLLNLDLEEFFYQISKMRVVTIFKKPPFNFSTELSQFLAELSTYKNRLPMGSPTSPALSNLYTRGMDNDLINLAKEYKITYTRYVDDLTFSGNNPIGVDMFYSIQQVLDNHSLRINTKKIKWMGENDVKMVTGLVLKDKGPHVTLNFLEDLERNLNRLKHVIEFSSITRGGASDISVSRFAEHLQGKLRFLLMIYGGQNPVYQKMNRLFNNAFNSRPFVESFNWNSFPYF